MERIGIFGGTFHPPHIGHIRAAQAAVQALKLDTLLMMPVNDPPHKQLPDGSPTAQQRLEMLRIATQGEPALQASDLEIVRGGVSYTYETVEQVRALYPNAQIFVLMGSDMFLTFHKWKNAQQILQQATLAVFCRGHKDEQSKIAEKMEELAGEGHAVSLDRKSVV